MELSDFITYGRILRRRLWLILSLVVTTAAVILATSFLRPPQYSTSVRFQVTAIPPTDVTLFQAARSGAYREEIAATRANFIEVLSSLEVAWDTVDALGLPITGPQLVSRVTVEESRTSDQVRITVTAPEPQQAADIANTLISTAIQRYGELHAYPLTLSRAFINDQLAQTQAELEQAQADLIQFKLEHNLGTLEASVDAQHNLIRLLELAHDEALAQGNRQLAAGYEKLIEARQLELLEIVQLSGQYSTLESRMRQLQGTYNFLLEKQTEAQLKENEARNLGFIQVLGNARVPTNPEPRVNASVLLLGVIIALAVGVIVAFMLEYFERLRLSLKMPAVDSAVPLADAH